MKLSRRQPDAGRSQDGGEFANELDEANWQILCEAAAAAHRGDVDAAGNATRRFDTDVPVDGQAGMYLWYALRYRVADMLGGRPSAEDLHKVAERFYPHFARVVRGDIGLLENTLRTVFTFASDQEKVSGGSFLALGVVTLGVLLDDPDSDMRAMRPHLAEWWRRNLEQFRDQGVLEDRSAAPEGCS